MAILFAACLHSAAAADTHSGLATAFAPDGKTLAIAGYFSGNVVFTLVELWRTPPYLHDGSANTVREVLVEQNRSDKHGVTSKLTPAQIDDLAAYLLSL